MTDTTQEPVASKTPSHQAYTVVKEGGSKRWMPVGAAWPHKDGNGFNVVVSFGPFVWTITLRVPTAKPE